MVRALYLLPAAVFALALVGCGGDGGSSPAGVSLADRWLRVGEDLRTNVQVYDRALPPQFAELLNPGLTAETPEEDIVTLPVHPEGELLGSFHLRRSNGVDVVWLIYDVPGEATAVEAVVAEQLDQTPWQVIGGQSNEQAAVVGFQSTVSGDTNGQAWVQPLPTTEEYEIVVARDDGEETIEVSRGAPVPLLEAELDAGDSGLVVGSLAGGAAQAGGLQEGDRIVSVGGQTVASQDELEQAYRSLLDAGEVRTSVVYILQISPAQAVEAPAFTLPPSRALPADFPAPFLQLDGMTVLEVSWATQPEGTGYQVSMVSTASPSDVAEGLRTALQGAGWEITEDTAVGFGTRLQFQNADAGQSGAAEVDEFELDSEYTGIVLRLQSAGSGGN